MSGLSCIVFDLDDTLYQEREFVLSGFSAVDEWVSSVYGVSGFGAACSRLFEAGVRGDTFDRAASDVGLHLSHDELLSLVNLYRTHTPLIALHPETRATLEILRDRFLLAVLTGGDPRSQRLKFEALSLDSLIGTAVFAGDWGASLDKPHERSWIEVESLTGFAGCELMYVADNPAKDWPACESRGWQFTRVRLSGAIYGDIDTPEGVAEICSITDLPDLLG
jgi:putative hydrolase of the HAD superfamily